LIQTDTRRILGGMSRTIDQITAEAMQLSGEEHARLADRLVESLDPADIGIHRDAWVSEMRRRRDDVRSGKVQPIPGEVALEQVRRAIGR
jgi:putative addiction module component (TIGR02574 family)